MTAAGRAAMMAAAGQTGRMSPGAVQALQRMAGNAAVAATLEQDRHLHHASPDHTVQRSPVHEVLRRPGRPLDPGARAEMEARLGADFTDVRVHTDAGAHEAAESVNAHAFTSGRDIVFQRGRYDIGTASGKEMLAHELIHVEQQRRGPVPGTDAGDGTKVSHPADPAEKEAEAGARKAMANAPVQRAVLPGQPARGARGVVVQRVRSEDEREDGEGQRPPRTSRFREEFGASTPRTSRFREEFDASTPRTSRFREEFDSDTESVPPEPDKASKPSGTRAPVSNKSRDAADVANKTVQPSTATSVAAGFREGTVTAASAGGAVAGAALGTVGSGAALVGAAKATRDATKKIGTAAEGTVKHRENRRSLRKAIADLVRHSGDTSRHGLTLGAGAARLNEAVAGAAHAGAAGASAAGGGLGAVTGSVQTVRNTRNAVKAAERVKRLRTVMKDQDRPVEAWHAVAQLADGFDEVDAEIQRLRADIEAKHTRGDGALTQADVEAWARDIYLVENRLAEAERDIAKFRRIRAEGRAMELALGKLETALEAADGQNERAGQDPPTLREIQEYAVKKNRRGEFKKAAAAISDVGTAGAGAATLALSATALAGGAALMATPVGWGLAGASAAAALPLGGYRAFKYYRKRWKLLETDEAGERPAGERIRTTLAFWRKVGGGKREVYAAALYEYAAGREPELDLDALGGIPDDVVATLQQERARATLEALGLPWADLKEIDPGAAKKRIAEKLAS